jgi:hypothetical protein
MNYSKKLKLPNQVYESRAILTRRFSAASGLSGNSNSLDPLPIAFSLSLLTPLLDKYLKTEEAL